jgi:hypothetical protein
MVKITDNAISLPKTNFIFEEKGNGNANITLFNTVEGNGEAGPSTGPLEGPNSHNTGD